MPVVETVHSWWLMNASIRDNDEMIPKGENVRKNVCGSWLCAVHYGRRFSDSRPVACTSVTVWNAPSYFVSTEKHFLPIAYCNKAFY